MGQEMGGEISKEIAKEMVEETVEEMGDDTGEEIVDLQECWFYAARGRTWPCFMYLVDRLVLEMTEGNG